MKAGGSVISPTGIRHLVAEVAVNDPGRFVTACGVEVAPYQPWGKPSRGKDYRHCSKCSIYGPVPKNWAERMVSSGR